MLRFAFLKRSLWPWREETIGWEEEEQGVCQTILEFLLLEIDQ